MISNKVILTALGGLISPMLLAQNPIVQTCYTTDPAPMVHDGRLYVYTGHDEDKADFSGCRNGGYTLRRIWSTGLTMVLRLP